MYDTLVVIKKKYRKKKLKELSKSLILVMFTLVDIFKIVCNVTDHPCEENTSKPFYYHFCVESVERYVKHTFPSVFFQFSKN